MKAGHSVKPGPTEQRGALPNDASQLAHNPLDRVTVAASVNRADVRGRCQGMKASTSEVDCVDLDVGRVVGQAKPGDECLQKRGFTRTGSSDDREMTANALEVRPERNLNLMARSIK
jgi:hypothetical protein